MSGPYLPNRWLISIGPGSQADFLARIKRLLPPWFGDDATPVLDGVLSGPAYVLAFVYSLIAYVKIQLRIATATDGFLDLASADFFGAALPRLAGEGDVAFRARIKASFWPARNTRPALVAALTALGLGVQVIEPWNPGDTGALNSASTLAYGRTGVWGSRTMPFQCFATVTRPLGSAVTNAQIYAAIEAARPVAIKVWVAIVG